MNLLEVMCHPDVDFTRTVSNDIIEMLQASRCLEGRVGRNGGASQAGHACDTHGIGKI